VWKVRKVARGCYWVQSVVFPFLWIAANELPLRDLASLSERLHLFYAGWAAQSGRDDLPGGRGGPLAEARLRSAAAPCGCAAALSFGPAGDTFAQVHAPNGLGDSTFGLGRDTFAQVHAPNGLGGSTFGPARDTFAQVHVPNGWGGPTYGPGRDTFAQVHVPNGL
jgi:hypothetical protein